jgi:type II secretory pathway predicted ATPase ExeA
MMGRSETKPILDFTHYLAERTRDFTGREWVFRAINDWLGDADGSRVFMLTGEPGSGKTAIAGRLTQFSQSVVSPPEGLDRLAPSFLSAVHFCSARDRYWIDPFTFAGSIATQLANRFATYRRAIEDSHEDRRVRVDISQDVKTAMNSQVIGMVVNVTAPSPESAFNRVVRDPLEELFRQGFDQQLVILVDALDEALLHSEEVGIVSLLTQADNLPADVRFILTSRPEIEVVRPLRRSGVDQHSLTSPLELTNSLYDVERYVRNKLAELSHITTKLGPDLSIDSLVTAVRDSSAGNFLYVDYLLRMLKDQHAEIRKESLSELPAGLDGIYLEFVERLTVSPEVWVEDYAPIVGTLAVAQQALTEEQLAEFAGKSKPLVRTCLKRLLQLLEADEALPSSKQTYSLYHRSFADFLLDRDRAEEYWCEPIEQHLRIADCLQRIYGGDWLTADDYAVLYLGYHLSEAEREADQHSQRTTRQQLVNRRAALLNDEEFSVARWLLALTRNFIGREEVIQAIDAWLAGEERRVLFLTGGPGTGKTTLAAWLVRLCRGAVPSSNYRRLGRRTPAFYYSLAPAFSYSLGLEPFDYNSQRADFVFFTLSLAKQLASHYRPFAQALESVSQRKTGVFNELLSQYRSSSVNVSSLLADIDLTPRQRWQFLRDLLLWPLDQLCAADFRDTIIMVIDALDEVFLSETFLDYLHMLISQAPPQVRWVLVSSPSSYVYDMIHFRSFVSGVSELDLSQNTFDIRSYAHRRLNTLPEPQRSEVADRIAATVRGNHLMARLMVDELSKRLGQ